MSFLELQIYDAQNGRLLQGYVIKLNEIQRREVEERKRNEKLELFRDSSDATLMEHSFKEFGGRRRALNDIIKLEQESLPKIKLENQTQSDSKRIPFSGAVKTKEQSYHRTKSFLDSPENNNSNMEYKLALEKQIQEKKERIKREKEYERELEFKEISRFEIDSEQKRHLKVSASKKLVETTKTTREEIKTKQHRQMIISKIPKLKHFTSSKRIEDILPCISKFSDLIGRTSQLSFASSKRGMLSVKNPPPVSLKEKQVIRKPVKIVQKFPVRTTELTTPPSLGKRSWPAGSRAISLQTSKYQLNENYKLSPVPVGHKYVLHKDSNENQVVAIPYQVLGASNPTSETQEKKDFDESLERQKALKALQTLWSEYEYENRVDLE